MRVFKTKHFERFAHKHVISDADLIKAIKQVEKGLIDANLGGNVIKQRIAKQGQGKSSGYRTIIFYRTEDKAFFVMGFEKSHKANISISEEQALKDSANIYFSLSESDLSLAIETGKLLELSYSEGK